MKLLVALALVVFVAARPSDDYSRYENFKVDELTENVRLLGAYVKCFEGLGNCTPEGKDFKQWMPDAVQSKCAKCSEHQKNLIAHVMQAINDKLPEDWVKLKKIHDPEGKYEEEIKQFIDKYNKKE